MEENVSESVTNMEYAQNQEGDNADELYQTHGDHHAPFVKDEQLAQFLTEMLKESEFLNVLDTYAKLEDDTIKTRVAALKYTDGKSNGEISYLALIAANLDKNVNEFVSCYPYLQGDSKTVEIVDVLEWCNMLEATIKCRYYSNEGEHFDFCFFATDYYINKPKYVKGHKLEISLAASSGFAQKASTGFSFKGQEALDFLAKIGKEPTFDENGVVVPVNFSTANLVAFLPRDNKAPDMAEFQSPYRDPESMEFYGNDVNRCIIKLNNETNLEVTLYFNGDLKLQPGDPIMGWLWLSGRIS